MWVHPDLVEGQQWTTVTHNGLQLQFFLMHIVIHTSPQHLSIQILPTRNYIILTNQVCQIGLI